MPATGRSHAVETSVHHPLAPLLRWLKDVTMRLQAQRARTALLQEVVGLMLAAGIDAFIGNTSEELAMANLASLPTMAVPLGTQPLLNAANSTRKLPLSLGIFGSPQTDANVGPRSQDGPCHKHCAPACCIADLPALYSICCSGAYGEGAASTLRLHVNGASVAGIAGQDACC